MPPILRITSSLLLLLLACSVHCKPDVSSLDRSLTPPDPAPSPAPSTETRNPLKNPEVRRALIRALARSIEKLGTNELDDLVVSQTQSTERPQSLFVRYFTSISTNNPAPTDPFGTVPPTEPVKQETPKESFPEVILNEVDKHIQSAEFQRVHPNEVHVTSKLAPQPFSTQQGKNDFTDSLTSPTEDNGSEGNSLRQGPTTDKPQVDDIRVEQHELKSVDSAVNDAPDGAKPSEEKTELTPQNTVDIFRAPLIAAFTVHQDYLTGATRGVVPLIPPDTVAPVQSAPVQSVPSNEVRSGPPNLPLQNEELRDLVRQITTHPASVQGRFPFLTREQVYRQEQLERQRAAQRQAALQGGQATFNTQIQNNGVSEQQLVDQRLRKIRQLQELQYLQERLLRLQQQLQNGF